MGDPQSRHSTEIPATDSGTLCDVRSKALRTLASSAQGPERHPTASEEQPGNDLGTELSGLSTETFALETLSHGIRFRSDGLDADHVKALAESPGVLPPIVIHKDTRTVIDGMHRVAAARARGQEHIEAVLFTGNIMGAYLLTLKLNSRHGLPLSRKDRRVAVERILAFCPSWSDRRIAAIAGVNHKTVGAVRGYSTGESAQSNTRVGLDGRERPLNFVEGRRRAMRMLSERPGSSVRQVADAVGLSEGTVRDVRRRMNEGEKTPGTAQKELRGRASTRPDPLTAPEDDSKEVSVGQQSGPDSSPDALGKLLTSLRSDPSIRATIAGRNLLNLLSAHAQTFTEGAPLAQAVPMHRKDTIADLARRCADAWLRFASEVEDSSTPMF